MVGGIARLFPPRSCRDPARRADGSQLVDRSGGLGAAGRGDRTGRGRTAGSPSRPSDATHRRPVARVFAGGHDRRRIRPVAGTDRSSRGGRRFPGRGRRSGGRPGRHRARGRRSHAREPRLSADGREFPGRPDRLTGRCPDARWRDDRPRPRVQQRHRDRPGAWKRESRIIRDCFRSRRPRRRPCRCRRRGPVQRPGLAVAPPGGAGRPRHPGVGGRLRGQLPGPGRRPVAQFRPRR